MSRLSIDVTDEQHQLLKAMAALQGKSIKEYILEKVLPAGPQTMAAEEPMQKLEALLQSRLASAHRGEFSDLTVMDIFRQAANNAAKP